MRNKTLILGAVAAFILAFQMACTNDKLDEPTCVVTEDVTYNNQIKAIIDQSCAYSTCHDGTAAPGNFTTYAGLQAFSDKLEQRVLIDRNMPPSYASGPKTLTDEEIALFTCWAASVFPE